MKKKFLSKMTVKFPRTHLHNNNVKVVDSRDNQHVIDLSDPRQMASYNMQRAISRDIMIVQVEVADGKASYHLPGPNETADILRKGAEVACSDYLTRRLSVIVPVMEQIKATAEAFLSEGQRIGFAVLLSAAEELVNHVAAVHRERPDITVTPAEMAETVLMVYLAVFSEAYEKVSAHLEEPDFKFTLAHNLALNFLTANQREAPKKVAPIEDASIPEAYEPG